MSSLTKYLSYLLLAIIIGILLFLLPKTFSIIMGCYILLCVVLMGKRASLHSIEARAYIFIGFMILIFLMQSKYGTMSRITAGEDKNTLLSEAVRGDENGKIAYLLKVKADPNHQRNPRKLAPLHIVAARYAFKNARIKPDPKNEPEIIRMLVKAGANINAIDGSGYTPLIYAVQQKKTLAVKELIDLGADVNFKTPTGRTALYWAVGFGASDQAAVEIAKILYSHAADPKICDNEGHAPIIIRPDLYGIRSDLVGGGFKCENGYAVPIHSSPY